MRRLRYVLLAGMLSSFTAAAPATLAQPAQPPAPAQEVTVNFLSQGEPDSLDPTRATAAGNGAAAVVRQVFEPLLRFDAQLEPRPAAAESYAVSPDGTAVTFQLRSDGRWSDGQLVTAQQFEFAWNRLLDPAQNADFAPLFLDAGITSAQAVDDSTLEIRLSQPFGALPALAALTVVSPLRPDIIAAYPDGWQLDPTTYIGNGPFKLSEWAHRDHLTLTQNPYYTAHANWPRPALTKVTLTMDTDGETELAAFKNNARAWTLVPDTSTNQVLNDPGLAAQSRQYTDLTTFWVQVNNARPPLSTPGVRRALAMALDRKAFIRDIAGGIGLSMTSIIPPGMPGFQADLGQELGFDPEAARKLLGQAGFPNGLGFPTLAFSFPATLANQRRAEYLQAQWKQNLGLDIHLSAMDSQAYLLALADKNYDLAFGGWAADYPDPQDWLNPLFGCQTHYNASSYCNPAFDQLVARADTASPLRGRLLLYDRAQALVVDETPVLPLFARGHLVLVKPWVQSTDGGALPITGLDEYPGSLLLDRVRILPH